MNITDVNKFIKDKKIINISYPDSFEVNIIEIILDDGSRVKLSSLAGISINVKKV